LGVSGIALEVFGSLWKSWKSLGVSGVALEVFGKFENIWKYLGVFGCLWKSLEVFEIFNIFVDFAFLLLSL
jgi:hypothetical protein